MVQTTNRWRRPTRWVFIACIITGCIILAIATTDQLRQAEMSLGTASVVDTATTLETSVLSRKSFAPPADGIPTTAQLGFVLRIARLDSVFRKDAVPRATRSQALAREFNASLMSLEEYRWIAQCIQRHYDTPNNLRDVAFHTQATDRLRMIEDLLLRATGGDLTRLTKVVEELDA